MKKKLGIGMGILAVALIGGTIIYSMNQPKAPGAVIEEDPYGIEYFTVPNMEQVFVNGVVKPEQSQEFVKEDALGIMGELQVENGQSIEEGTLLYTYENKEAAAQLSDMSNQVARMETQKKNAAYKLDLAIKNWKKLPEEERMQTLEEIKIDMSTADMEAEIKEMYSNIESLKEQRFKDILAPFAGKVYIPEVKDANSPILKLISDNFYVAGTVNEKDVEKLTPEQVCDIKVISNDYSVTGKVMFIDINPSEEGNDMGYGEPSVMSSYPVKLSLDTLEGIRNGYHVQAVINMGSAAVTIPTSAIHQEGELFYVLVNDFGTVVRRVIQLGEAVGEETPVTSGLEAEDQIIISSLIPIEEGQLLMGSSDMEFMNPEEPMTGEE